MRVLVARNLMALTLGLASASSTATSAPARSTPCARPCIAAAGRRTRRRATDRARRPVADPLVADRRRHREICPDPHARRQQRRGRHAGADGAGAAGAGPAHDLVFVLGMIGAALFYGDAFITPAISVLSAVEGPEARHAGVRALRDAAHDRHPGRAVRGAEPRHGARRGLLRADHRGLVRRDLRSSARSTSSTIPRVLRGDQSVLRASHFLSSHGTIALVTLGAVFLAVTGARGALCRPRPFRPPADPDWPGSCFVLPALLLNYFGQGALVLANPEAIENPFFLLVPGWALLPDGGARHRRDRDREPGGDHRRLFADAAGDPARPPAAPGDPCTPPRTQAGQIYMPRVNLILLIGVLLLVADVPVLERAGLRLWHRRHRRPWWSTALLGFIVIWKVWHWPWWRRRLLIVPVPRDRLARSSSPTCSRSSRAAGCRSLLGGVVMV